MATENGKGSAIASQLAHRVCQAITVLHEQNPSLLTETICQNWKNPAYPVKLAQKLTEVLEGTSTSQQSQKIQQIFSQVFSQAFLDTPEFLLLKNELEHLGKGVELNEQPTVTKTLTEGAIALLLLDAENLQLTAQQEDYLSTLCSYPLQVKIAFANWKKLGNHDAVFHQRDYDLIHVPTGNDMADGKMIAVGSSLKDHYPKVGEVLVCSSDKVMTSLCTKLRQQGLIVYKIQKQNDGTLSILNSGTGKVSKYPEEVLPTLEQSIKCLQEITWKEQQKQSRSWVKLSIISKRFHEDTGFPITKVVATYIPGKRARDLFIDHPELFVVHKPSDEDELYISLFAPLKGETGQNQESKASNPAALQQLQEKKTTEIKVNHGNAEKAKASTSLTLKSAKELEAAIVSIIRDLNTQNSSVFVNIGIVSIQFYHLHQIPITSALKQLNIDKKYPAFLQSCKSLEVQKQDNNWVVKLQ